MPEQLQSMGEVFNSGFTGFLEQYFYFLFRFLQRGLTGPSQHHAAFESRQRFLERQIALFEAFHQLFEVAHGRLKIGLCFGCGFGRRHDRERYTCAAAGSNREVPAVEKGNFRGISRRNIVKS